jgi:hypothetical protein
VVYGDVLMVVGSASTSTPATPFAVDLHDDFGPFVARLEAAPCFTLIG